MSDTWVFLIREHDWDSDAYTPEGLGGADRAELSAEMAAHARFQEAVERLGARLTGGYALANRKYGGTVAPGRDGRDPVWSDAALTDSSEVITGFYAVECDEEVARRLAPLVPSAGTVEMRRVHQFG